MTQDVRWLDDKAGPSEWPESVVPVSFSMTAAQALETAATAAAVILGDQAPARLAWRQTGLTGFTGAAADVFRDRGRAQQADWESLSQAFWAVAQAVTALSQAVVVENRRRELLNEAITRDRQRREHYAQTDGPIVGWSASTHHLDYQDLPRPSPTGPVSRVNVDGFGSRQPLLSCSGLHSGQSSAVPDSLRAFTACTRAADRDVDAVFTAFANAHAELGVLGDQWGRVDAEAVIVAARQYLADNQAEAAWAESVAASFETAGRNGLLRAPTIRADSFGLAAVPGLAGAAGPVGAAALDRPGLSAGPFLLSRPDLVHQPGLPGQSGRGRSMISSGFKASASDWQVDGVPGQASSAHHSSVLVRPPGLILPAGSIRPMIGSSRRLMISPSWRAVNNLADRSASVSRSVQPVSHHSLQWSDVGQWFSNLWHSFVAWLTSGWGAYLMNSLLMIGGAFLLLTGAGGPLGMALISGGANAIIQKVNTGTVDYVDMGLTTLFGLVGGAGGTLANLVTRTTASTVTKLAVRLAVQEGVGIAMNDVQDISKNLIEGADWSDGLDANTAVGGLGALFGFVSDGVVRTVDKSALAAVRAGTMEADQALLQGVTARTAVSTVNFAGGTLQQEVNDQLSGNKPSAADFINGGAGIFGSWDGFIKL